MDANFVIKGDVLYSESTSRLSVHRDGYLVCEGGKVAGVFPALPEKYSGLPLEDRTGRLVIPGFVDLHLHAPQYAFRGLGMDLELLDWLNTHTFPEEAKYADAAYAELAYGQFVDALRDGGTTRASIFATVHKDATLMPVSYTHLRRRRCFQLSSNARSM